MWPNVTKRPVFNFEASFISNPRWCCLVDLDGEIYTIQLDHNTLNLPLREFLEGIQRYINATKKSER